MWKRFINIKVESCLEKDARGNGVFYPYGSWGKGFIVPAEAAPELEKYKLFAYWIGVAQIASTGFIVLVLLLLIAIC